MIREYYNSIIIIITLSSSFSADKQHDLIIIKYKIYNRNERWVKQHQNDDRIAREHPTHNNDNIAKIK